MRVNIRRTAVSFALLALVVLSACGAAAPQVQTADEKTSVTSAAPAAIAAPATATPLPLPTTAAELSMPVETKVEGTEELTADEVAGILFMREEEKLARDVYQVLYAQWSVPIFDNIAGSEATHMDAVLTLIERYGLEDPVDGRAVGEFADPTLQALYDQLVEQGSASLVAALEVGAAIEEIDILDLQAHLDETERADIRGVYENLLKGSRNHLRSFSANIERRAGEAYAPQYLDEDAYQAIIGGDTERGRAG